MQQCRKVCPQGLWDIALGSQRALYHSAPLQLLVLLPTFSFLPKVLTLLRQWCCCPHLWQCQRSFPRTGNCQSTMVERGPAKQPHSIVQSPKCGGAHCALLCLVRKHYFRFVTGSLVLVLFFFFKKFIFASPNFKFLTPLFVTYYKMGL